MIETYTKLAENVDHPVVKELAKQLAENEKQHHAKFTEMIRNL